MLITCACRPHGPDIDLTPRELEIVSFVASGYTNDEIGRHMFLSPRTVQSHVANARMRCDARSRTHLAVLGVMAGVQPSGPLPVLS